VKPTRAVVDTNNLHSPLRLDRIMYRMGLLADGCRVSPIPRP
jgi:hypothetical protein